MHASVDMGCQGKSGPSKIHEVILVFFAAGRKLFVVDIKYECQNELQSKQVQTLS